jgi:ADP-ribose pyrophosphatase YjhB (NUDIX family)
VAAAIIDPDGRALAVRRRDNGHWEPPGGVLELGETIEDGLCREVAEETGLAVGIDRLTGVYKNMTAGVVALVFRCRVIGGALQTSDETTAFRWMTPAEIRGDMTEAYAVRLLDALDDELPVRAHDGVVLVPPRAA